MINFKVQMVGLSLLTATLLQGCGGASFGDSVKVNLDPTAGTAQVEVTMSDGLEIAINGEFPIDEYGSISFVPATRTERAKIVFEYSLQHLIDGQLGGFGAVTALPNGAPLPTPMLPPLVKIPVTSRGSVTVDAVLGIVPELQVGAMIGIAQFRTQYFPAGIAISQTFRNQEGIAFAVISLYGPGLNNSTPGGVFLGANFGEVLDLQNLNPNSANALMAASSNRSLVSSVRTQQMMSASWEEVSEDSSEWDEQRYDPKGKLRNSRTAYNALQNAKAILRKR